MTRNMGAFDRGLRAFVVAPVAIVAAFLVGAGTVFGVILFVVAGIMLMTAVTAFCPTYLVRPFRRAGQAGQQASGHCRDRTVARNR